MRKPLTAPEWGAELKHKIDTLKARRTSIKLGAVDFASPLLLAPMSAICNRPFRLLMEDLGAGGTVSELISCHGINYENEKTREMLYLDEAEENVGLQLFGEDAEAMAKAAKVAESFGPKFIDINMGCPVRKVVTKGGGSALLKDVDSLPRFFDTIKAAIKVPLTIKIRLGWDSDQLNADRIIQVAKESGVEFVAVHGRTRAQQYKGDADWNRLEELATESPIPMIGNGDLHQSYLVAQKKSNTRCKALMLGRGALRNPFIFLEPYVEEGEKIEFTAQDTLEVIHRYANYLEQSFERERIRKIQLVKMMVWFAAGYPGTTQFRGKAFQSDDFLGARKVADEYFLALGNQTRHIDYSKQFMAGGHG